MGSNEMTKLYTIQGTISGNDLDRIPIQVPKSLRTFTVRQFDLRFDAIGFKNFNHCVVDRQSRSFSDSAFCAF